MSEPRLKTRGLGRDTTAIKSALRAMGGSAGFQFATVDVDFATGSPWTYPVSHKATQAILSSNSDASQVLDWSVSNGTLTVNLGGAVTATFVVF